jgi:divalent metal cation (Fe/Co/Zn/Cd) transporter
LAADADHTLSDVWVTLSVIASLVAVKLGLQWMDALVALVIVAFIVFTAWGIVRKTATVLVDAAPIAPEAITQAASGTPGVQRVLRARSHGTPDAVYIDLDVQVAPVISTGFAYNIADAVRERVKKAFPHASEVQIQISPDTDSQPGYLTAARAAADALALSVHEIIGISTPAGKILEMHVEVPPGMTLREAHNRTNELESSILQQIDIVEVITHIEPGASGHSLPTHSPEALQIQDGAMIQLAGRFPQAHWHHASIYRNGYGFAFSAHCHLPGDISLETAHHIAEEAELFLRSKFPRLHRVTIHTEPEEGS